MTTTLYSSFFYHMLAYESLQVFSAGWKGEFPSKFTSTLALIVTSITPSSSDLSLPLPITHWHIMQKEPYCSFSFISIITFNFFFFVSFTPKVHLFSFPHGTFLYRSLNIFLARRWSSFLTALPVLLLLFSSSPWTFLPLLVSLYSSLFIAFFHHY